MNANIRPVEPSERLAPSHSVYLESYLAPFKQWLDQETVTEIMVNRPGEVWVEGGSFKGMEKVLAPEVDDNLIQRLAE